MMRALAVSVLAALAFVQTARSEEGHDEHGTANFHMVEIDVGWNGDDGEFLIEADGWYGGDSERLWLRADADFHDGDATGSYELYFGWNIDPFWDVLAGVRIDAEDDTLWHGAISLVGLAPQFVETELSLYLSEAGDFTLRYVPTFEMLITQRLAAEIEGRIDFAFSDVASRDEGAGFTSGEIALRLRYAVSRRVAPFVAFVHEERLGESRGLARDAGESVSASTVQFGIRFNL